MNKFKKYLIWFGIIIVCGIGLFITGIVNDNTTISSMGTGFLAVGIVKLMQYMKIMKDPKISKEYAMKQTEERTVYIANKSRSLMFALSIYIECIVMIIVAFMKQVHIATYIGSFICLQLILNIAVYFYYNKKY